MNFLPILSRLGKDDPLWYAIVYSGKLREDYAAPEQADYALQVLTASTETLLGIDGLQQARMGRNLAGGAYDSHLYAEFAGRRRIGTLSGASAPCGPSGSAAPPM